jgi:subtilase family serine protease
VADSCGAAGARVSAPLIRHPARPRRPPPLLISSRPGTASSLRRLAAGLALAAAAVAGCSASPAAPARRARTAGVVARPASVPGLPGNVLTPAQIQRAYDVLPLYREGVNGAGQTIVIVDPFGSPTIETDLRQFDARFGLAGPPSFRVIQPAGPVPPFQPGGYHSGVAGETTLDVEWAHVMAPRASILLVETPAAEIEGATGFRQIAQALTYVVRRHLGGVVSMSLGATEETFASAAQLRSFRSPFELAARPPYRVTMVAATGDDGASGPTYSNKTYYARPVVGWPASDPLVTAVGGTQLRLTAAGVRRSPDVAWFASGGGYSSVFSKPAYQDKALAGDSRGIPDLSMDASCQSSVAIFASFPGVRQHWSGVCGTSLATPLFAGVVALADQVAGHPLGLINPALYSMAAHHDRGIVDVTEGGNSVRFRHGPQVQGYQAGPGYDLVTGLGTVDSRFFVPELAAASRQLPS